MSQYKTLEELVNIDSPSGFTTEACKYVFNLLKAYGYKPEYTNKGAVRCALGKNPKLAIAAHIDTLGAIVSGIKKDGTLSFSKLGGPSLTSAEGEYVNVHTLGGKTLTGTLLLNNPSSHANEKRETEKRNYDTMHIRLDEKITDKKECEKLGVSTGDIICFEPRYRECKNGFIKSRFMDNKAGCFVLFEIARRMKEEEIEAPVELFFSNYEEVGHGGTAGYSTSIEELLVIDMGVIGDGLEGDEYSCSICVKDSSGPYDYQFRKTLVQLADKYKIPYKLDVYPFYSSDGSAALRAGNDFRVALIGPGVAASHGVERTHTSGIEATIDLTLCYIHQYLNNKK
jgi:putative aminopeptidase FrvX